MTDATWAGRSTTPPAPPSPGSKAEGGRWVPVAGVIAALGLVGGGGYILGNSGGSEAVAAPTPVSESTEALESSTTTAVPSTTTPTTAAPTTAAPTTAAAPTTTAPPATAATPTTAAPTTTAPPATAVPSEVDENGEPIEADNQVVIQEGEVRGAVLRGGVLYLGGAVPSREVADQIIALAAAVVGEENIVDEYVIDPDAEVVPGAPLFIDDVVLFGYGSSSYDPQFEPLLDLGLALLAQNPSVKVTIVTHTDASGPASYNKLLSTRRGQSVAQYWLDRGISSDQIVIDARGEDDPRADNHTEAGAQLNRRAEFYVEGLLP